MAVSVAGNENHESHVPKRIIMLEFKNVQLEAVPHELSFIARLGEVTAIRGERGSGKTSVVNAILGRAPVVSGFVTIDGELVTVGSAPFFRKTVSYVPQDVRLAVSRLSVVVDEMLAIAASQGRGCAKAAVAAEMATLGITEDVLRTDVRSLDGRLVRLVLAALGSAIGGSIFLLDEPVDCPDTVMSSFLRRQAERGRCVVVTESGDYVDCDKTIMI